ncbi:MAG: PIN domain-containing protein [Propionibacteriaceae bacterium]|nr:PIN domain-containing protein [Propionibacteriaceae bacterium]
MVSVDTNVLLRATLAEPGLENESRAAQQFLASNRQTIVICDLVIAEYVHALAAHYHLDRPFISELVLTIVQLPHIQCSTGIVTAALTHYVNKPKLSFEDCFIAEHARANRALPLWTFDRKLAHQHESAARLEGLEPPTF